MYSYGPPHMAVQKQDDQLELTYSNYVRTKDVTLKTCQRRWMIGRSGERGSGISLLAAWHDDESCYRVSKRPPPKKTAMSDQKPFIFNNYPLFHLFKLIASSPLINLYPMQMKKKKTLSDDICCFLCSFLPALICMCVFTPHFLCDCWRENMWTFAI